MFAILTRMDRACADGHDLFRWAKASVMRLVTNSVQLQLAPVPSTGMGRDAARAVEDPFITEPAGKRQKAGPVSVWTETGEVSSTAFWALNAMANAG
jgi:hypothetical protein